MNREVTSAAVSDTAARCPLCGRANACGMAAGEAGRCWCVDTVFDASLLASVPEAARGIACICALCAAQQRSG